MIKRIATEKRCTRRRTSSVELDGALQPNDRRGVSLSYCRVELLKGVVVVGDVRLVVLLVVELHDFAADGGFESTIVVREVRECGDREAPGLAEARGKVQTTGGGREVG